MKESALIIYMADIESLEATTGFVRKLKDDGNFNVDFVTFEINTFIVTVSPCSTVVLSADKLILQASSAAFTFVVNNITNKNKLAIIILFLFIIFSPLHFLTLLVYTFIEIKSIYFKKNTTSN